MPLRRFPHRVLVPATRRLAAVLALTFAAVSPAVAQTVRDSLWLTDGSVNAIASTGTTVFVGGAFENIGPPVGTAGAIDRGTGLAGLPYPRVNGTVYAVAGDGVGGWYVGGAFTSVRGVARTNLAHLLADGSLDGWSPEPDGSVRALAVANGVVYVGGEFQNLAGQPRSRLAAFDVATGTLGAWAPPVNDAVLALLVSNGIVYAGGSFSITGITPVPRVAAFDAVTGALQPTPLAGGNAGSSVTGLQIAEPVLYMCGTFARVGGATLQAALLDPVTAAVKNPRMEVWGPVNVTVPDGAGGFFLGGGFSQVQGQARANLAHVLADGSLAAWNPGTNDSVRTLLLVGDTLFVGGEFGQVGGQARLRLAAVSASTGAVLPWAPDPDGRVNALARNGSTLYVGGEFTNIEGILREGLVTYDLGTLTRNATQPWGASHAVKALAVGTDRVVVGGDFTAIGPAVGTSAAFDPNTGTASQPYTSSNGQVFVTLPDGAGGWYLGGMFTKVQGQTRTNLAHILANGSVASWTPNVPGIVRALCRTGGRLYVGGEFSLADGQSRTAVAAWDEATGTLSSWNVGTMTWGIGTPVVRALLALGDTLYIGGSFSALAGQSRTGLASVHAATGALTTWDPHPTHTTTSPNIGAMLLYGGRLYVFGLFQGIAGQARTGLAALDPVSGTASAWNPSVVSLNEYALAAANGRIYVGGTFSSINAVVRTNLAAIDTLTGAATAWAPNPGQSVRSLALAGGTLFVGGDFTTIAGQSRLRLASFDVGTQLLTSWNPSASGAVYAVTTDGSRVFAGGQFITAGGVARNRLAALTLGSGVAYAMNPDVNGEVLSITISGNIAYFGGAFTTVAGATRNRAAAWDFANGLHAFNPSATGVVRAVAVSGSTIYLGGDFLFMNNGGAVRRYAGAVNNTIGTALAWDAGMSAPVRSLTVTTAGILAGGVFDAPGSLSRDWFGAVDITTGAATTLSPKPNSPVRAILVRGNTLYMGGDFTQFGSTNRVGLAAMDRNTGMFLPWAPTATGGSAPVRTLAASGDTIYVGGALSLANSLPRARLAAFSGTTGALLPWTANANGTVEVLQTDGPRLLVGGSFFSVGMQPHANLAAFDAVSGAVRPFDAGLNADVHTLFLDGSRLIAGGRFTLARGALMQHLAAFDTTTGDAVWTDREVDAEVLSLARSGGTFYAGGSFTFVGTTARNRLAAFDVATGGLLPWNPNANQAVWAVTAGGGLVHAGGDFTTIGGQPRAFLAEIDSVTGLATPSISNTNGQVRVLRNAGDRVYVGGNFTTVGGQSRTRLAAIQPGTGAVLAWAPSSSVLVRSMALEGTTLFAGTLAYDTGTGAPTGFSLPALGGAVHALLADRGTLYAGGAFTSFAGQGRRSFAGVADPAYQPLLAAPPHPRDATAFTLAQNQPNPFRALSSIRFTLPDDGAVRLELFEVSGRRARVLVDGERLLAGPHEVRVDGRGLTPGLYWYRLSWNGAVRMRRMVALP